MGETACFQMPKDHGRGAEDLGDQCRLRPGFSDEAECGAGRRGADDVVGGCVVGTRAGAGGEWDEQIVHPVIQIPQHVRARRRRAIDRNCHQVAATGSQIGRHEGRQTAPGAWERLGWVDGVAPGNRGMVGWWLHTDREEVTRAV